MGMPDFHRGYAPGSPEDIAAAKVVLDRMNAKAEGIKTDGASVQRILIAIEERLGAVHGTLLRTATAIDRLVAIEEERIAIDKANAMILSGVMGGEKGEGPRHFEDYRESAGDGSRFEVLVAGEWLPANVSEDAEIRAMIQNRKRRR